ncbi:MAG: hypothetical protein RIB58_14160 [Phycisphaerales bacterium]
MSSLLEGIEVGDSGGSKSSGGGPNPKVIKGAVAGVLFLLAAVVLAMNFNIIPSPFGGGESVTNSAGDTVEYKPTPQAEVQQLQEQLQREEQEFIQRGGVIGGS